MLKGKVGSTTTVNSYKEVRSITATAISRLCIDNSWYIKGNNDDYGKLIKDKVLVKHSLSSNDIVEIARDIVSHSYIKEPDPISFVATKLVGVSQSAFSAC